VRRIRIISAFVSVVLRGVVRDPQALFFMVALPVAIIVIIGATFGGVQRLDIGVVQRDHGVVASAVVDTLRAATGVRVHVYKDLESVRRAVRRQAIAAGIELPADLDERAAGSGFIDLPFVTNRATSASFPARNIVDDALGRIGGRVAAARLTATATGIAFRDALREATAVALRMPGIVVTTRDVGSGRAATLSRFSLTAPQNLVLFVFISAAASSAAIVRMRRGGLLRRVLASPVSAAMLTGGIAAGWFAIATCQSLIIIVVGTLLFGVDWGDPLAATVLVTVYALVGSGVGLLTGAAARDADRVGAIAPVVGIVLGALGGCMIPLEFFPPSMRAVAHVVPQFWAVTAWQRLVFDGAGVAGIAGPVGVLAAFAVVFLALAAIVLQRDLVQA
jgi:ABC-2 type transport system permease protein